GLSAARVIPERGTLPLHDALPISAGATTNSDAGVTDLLGRCGDALEAMQDIGMPLLVHGEVTDPDVDLFDREAVFIERVMIPLRSEEHTSELQSRENLVCRLLLEK